MLGDGDALIKLQSILRRCQCASDKRNEYIHGLWAQDVEGEAALHDADGKRNTIPTVAELSALHKEIFGLAHELNEARMRGFLGEAIAAKGIVN